ncbi:hypothetical protein CDO44_04860 [Pigmentiphaga sp. NML080357]|uniref:PepSY-associated TM helix domain-containing protein n=1 Tax=Pigmentiphaga sp. NML080357 TaxID=2008675 RepID=UPI000B4123CE|nr:PepSY-associated TM helix domain-containing protein [Pigmentiphaga sp. NML080357]OVZ62202.1 hypothetical protein CDO44_04860 [Pigmentiphaga sp. NML080357]
MPGFGRSTIVLWHRYVGLAMAGFLLIASLTGSLLAFREAIDEWLAPRFFVADSPADAPLLDPYVLRERVAAQVGSQGRIDAVVLHLQPGRTARFPVAPNPAPGGGMHVLDYDEVHADPHSGQVQGRRKREGLGLRPEQIVPSLFVIHHSLALPGKWGTLLLGLISLLWTVDCFAGAFLTFPRGRPFLSKWKTAWAIKWRAGFYRATLDVHRAGGLWLWAVLLLFAWSSVMFNLRDTVYRPAMGLFLSFDDSWRSVPLRLQLDRRRGVYAYLVHSTADIRPDVGNTAVLIDADSGAYRGRWLPGAGPAGNVVSNWMGALHMAHPFGLPYRVFVCIVGLAAATLSVTGVAIWAKKWRARSSAKSKRQIAPTNDTSSRPRRPGPLPPQAH